MCTSYGVILFSCLLQMLHDPHSHVTSLSKPPKYLQAPHMWFSEFIFFFFLIHVFSRDCLPLSFWLFCPCCSTERLTPSMPLWFQLKHSHQQPYSLLRLHPDLPITIHHCFYLPFARDGEKTRGRAWQREREPGMVLIGFHMYWNQILIFFLFFKWEKVHCPTKGDFCGDLGKEELKWASGAPLSPVDCV